MVGRDASIPVDGGGTRVVCGEGESKIVVIVDKKCVAIG
jgi:hypothetical protein